MIIFFNFLLFFIQTGVMCWLWRMKSCHVHTQYLKNTFLRYYMFTYDTVIIIIISSLPKGKSLASKFSNSLGFQPSSSYPHMSHVIHHRSCPFLAFPLVSFLPFSLLAPISSDHLPLQHFQSSYSFCHISFLLSFSGRGEKNMPQVLGK